MEQKADCRDREKPLANQMTLVIYSYQSDKDFLLGIFQSPIGHDIH